MSHEQFHLPVKISKTRPKSHPLWRICFGYYALVHVYVGSAYSAQYGLPHNACMNSRNCTFLTLSSPSLYTDPATLPRHEQVMGAVRVIRTNYSLLWQDLDASKVLPKLVDKSVISEAEKRKVESYQQSCGQNAVIINALFSVEYAPEGLLTICDVLQTTPGKEHIAQHILRGAIQSVFRFRLPGGCNLTSTYTLIFFFTCFQIFPPSSI